MFKQLYCLLKLVSSPILLTSLWSSCFLRLDPTFISSHEFQSIECFLHGIVINLSDKSIPLYYPGNRNVVV